MYPKNSASPPRIYVGPVVQISDGAVQTSGVAVTVTPEGGSETAGGGTIAYSTKGGVWYTPTQAETNYSAFVVEASKAGCIPSGVTVVTTDSAIAGRVNVATNQDKSGYGLAADQAVNVTKVNGTAQTARDLGAQLDAAVTSRAPAATAVSNATWTDARAGKLDNLDATVTSRHAAGAAVAKSPATLAPADCSGNLPVDVKAYTTQPTVTGATLAANQHVIADSVGADVGITQAGADKVWGSAARTLTSFGTLVADIWGAATRTLTAIGDSAGVTTLLARIVGTLTAGNHQPQSGDSYALANGTSGFAAIKGQTATIDAKTTNLPSDPADQSLIIDATNAIMSRLGAPNGASVSADVAAVKTDTAATLTESQSHPTLAEVEASTVLAKQALLSTVAGYLDTEIAAILAVVTKLDAMLELDGALYRFTVNALENAPTGSGSGLDAAGVRAAIGLAAANLDTQLSNLPTDADVNAACDTAIADASLATAAALSDLHGDVVAVAAAVVDVHDHAAAAASQTTAAAIRGDVGLAAANLDAQLAALPTDADVNASCDQAIGDAALATAANLADLHTDVAAVAADVAAAHAHAAAADTQTTAAAIRADVGLASANLDAQLEAIPTANEVTDAVLDEMTADHQTAGSVGKAISTSSTGGVDVDAVAAAVAGRLTGQVTVQSPVAIDGRTLTIKIGDSYLAAESRQLALSSDAWPDLVAAPAPTAIRLVARQSTASWTATLTATAARSVQLSLTHAQTVTLKAGRWEYDIEAAWADGRVNTLVSRGVLNAVADVAA